MLGECQKTFNEKSHVWEGMSYFQAWLKAPTHTLLCPWYLIFLLLSQLHVSHTLLDTTIFIKQTILRYYPAVYIVQTCHKLQIFLLLLTIMNKMVTKLTGTIAIERNLAYSMRKLRGLQVTVVAAAREYLKLQRGCTPSSLQPYLAVHSDWLY